MPERSAAEKQRLKLEKLIEIEGFPNVEALLEATITDTVSPAICMNDGCDYTCEMEPDQARGWCEACGTSSMKIGARSRRPDLSVRPWQEQFGRPCRRPGQNG